MATPDDNFFKDYLNPVFVETGSCVGEGIRRAVFAGFQEIHSIELSPELHEHCVNRFKDQEHVHLFCGDSRDHLAEIISKIDCPITFWLDAHYSGGTTAGADVSFSLFDEIEIIKNHSIKNHTILIDDLRDWGSNDLLIEKLLEINPNYTIMLVDGLTHKDDILVAIVR